VLHPIPQQPVMLYAGAKSLHHIRYPCLHLTFTYASLILGLFNQVTLATLKLGSANRSSLFCSPLANRSGCEIFTTFALQCSRIASKLAPISGVVRSSKQPVGCSL